MSKRIPRKVLEEFLDYYDFSLVKHNGYWSVSDNQGANLGSIEEERFNNLNEVLDRFDGSCYENDYIWRVLEDEYSSIPSIRHNEPIAKVIEDIKDIEDLNGIRWMLEVLRDYD